MIRTLTIVFICGITVARVAAGDDKCLTGASTLSDQRALASVRAATDAACPCASFTGGPGATASAYQKCARNVLKSALTAGTVRKACKSTATAINTGATCGSTKTACGRFTPAGKTPLSCRLKSASSCKDGKKYQETACATEKYCADVVDWTATTCVDVRENGAFGVGVQVIPFTKMSVVNPSAQRELDTVVWYPTSAGATPVSSQYGGVLDAPLDNSGGPYPLLMFSHGSCGLPTQALFLMPLLASQGFIITAPPHPGNTLLEFPNCGTQQAQLDSALERPQDIIFVLDAMLQKNGDATSAFFGTIDAAKLGMSGHSFGGYTTYATTAMDSRFKAAMAFAPFVVSGQVLTIPSLTMLGQIDSVVNDPAIRTAYAGSSAPKYLVEIANTGHYAWSDLCFPSSDCNPPTTLTQDEAHAAVLRWVLPFLEVYLNDDASFAPFLAPVTIPGFDLSQSP